MPRLLLVIQFSAILLCHTVMNGAASNAGHGIILSLPDTSGIKNYKAPFPSREKHSGRTV
jgi:hypothetical protein